MTPIEERLPSPEPNEATPRGFSWRAIEPFSCYSHLFGAALAVAGLVALLIVSEGATRIVGFSIYGASLILLYLASSVYHWLDLPPGGREWLNRCDHVAIFFLIAGTYTPVCLVTLRGGWGWSLFGVVWGVALSGALVKLLGDELPRWISTAMYIGMGWIALVACVPLVEKLPATALLWLLLGGVLYTAGGLIYASRRPDPYPPIFGFHEVFHLFVLAGSAAHFVFMLRYVAPA